MHIGIDFDNTIVSYDALFHRVALEKKLIPSGLSANKVAVRDHLRSCGLENTWVEMQGYVYGARMDEAEIYPGFTTFLDWARSAKHQVSIVSHKTRHPFAGPQYDLHAAARSWINIHLQDSHSNVPWFADHSIYFELTKIDKISRIGSIGCDVFIDDLPEILLAENMPKQIRKILFDPDSNHACAPETGLSPVASWAEVRVTLDH
jgi:hypothetical protein